MSSQVVVLEVWIFQSDHLERLEKNYFRFHRECFRPEIANTFSEPEVFSYHAVESFCRKFNSWQFIEDLL